MKVKFLNYALNPVIAFLIAVFSNFFVGQGHAAAKSSIEMVLVNSGTFQMGGDMSSFDYQEILKLSKALGLSEKNLVTQMFQEEDAKPVHEVSLSSFYISKYEITQKQFQGIVPTLFSEIDEINPFFLKKEDYPIYFIDWYSAVIFCNELSKKDGFEPVYKISKERDPNNLDPIDGKKYLVTADFTKNGYRLPTEAEWEYAARGGHLRQSFIYSGSNNIKDVAWYSNISPTEVQVVGKKKPNSLGIYDMSGNVSEWCWDWYSPSYSSDPKKDPKGPQNGKYRTHRGGSLGEQDSLASVYSRNYRRADFPYLIGFRLVRNATK